MNRALSKVVTALSGAGLIALSGCGATPPFASQRAYHPYDPVTPAAVVWPAPAEAQPAGYHAGPATAPTAGPAAPPGAAPAPVTAPVVLPSDVGERT